MAETPSVAEASLPLERDFFLRSLLRQLSGTLEDVVGLDEASGYISVVGGAMGEDIDAAYRTALKVERLSPRQVSEVLVDLKRRIQGDFYVVEETADRIVLGNRRCPFGAMVAGRPSLCMMTSNVFGRIAADNIGYARVEIPRAIAKGDRECLVVVHLNPSAKAEPSAREYFGRVDAARG
ncbi:methanogen output domain 1-containing protein [Propylenella binzhouense]|uniref:Transcriptional regulator n=1 Tax=Propylenella binzhouense TaxID=2555902 RepID=A0A964WUM7_9HYPH|nr:methanogen output domain 1-containing protein [Propylenella binzhouense]MYZ49236.1 transcriptional regulator [Propylenella binzhouense]